MAEGTHHKAHTLVVVTGYTPRESSHTEPTITKRFEDLQLDDAMPKARPIHYSKSSGRQSYQQYVQQQLPRGYGAKGYKQQQFPSSHHGSAARQSAGSRQWQSTEHRHQQSQYSHARHHQRPQRQCIRHKLLGRCHIGSDCHFLHSGPTMSHPPTAYIPVPRGVTSAILRSFLGKVDSSPEKKFFIPVLSDRTQQEIKIVAEDYTALKLAKRMVFKKLEAASPRGRHGKDCTKYKLLGDCDNEGCQYVHREICDSPSVGYVAHPLGSTADVRKAVGTVGRFPSGVYLTTISDKDKDQEVKVLAENKETLQLAMKEILQQLEGALCKIATTLKFCYVHPDGVEYQSILHLQVCDDSVKGKELLIEQVTTEESFKSDSLWAEDFGHLSSRELPHSVDYILNHPERIKALLSSSAQVRFLRGYREQIQTQVGAALKWLYDKKVHPKLEGRFGKLKWTDLPISFRKRPVSTKDFINFISSNEHRRSFRTKVEKASTVQAIEQLRDLGSTVESYDINMGKLDIRLLVVSGKLEIMTAKKDELKILLADILCLHRNHDMRLSLGCFQTIAQDDPEILKILESVHLSASGELTLMPLPHKKCPWTAELIRHKTRRAYLYGKKNYLVTVTCVESYKIKATQREQTAITLTQRDWEQHYEVEVHNLDWEIAFGHVNGCTTQKSLCLLLEPDKVPPELLTRAQGQWNPDTIMADFVDDGFLQIMDDINHSMDIPRLR